jgi:hypothetical protein
MIVFLTVSTIVRPVQLKHVKYDALNVPTVPEHQIAVPRLIA